MQRLRRRDVQQHDGIKRVHPLRPWECRRVKRSHRLLSMCCRELSRHDGRNDLQELPCRHLQLVYGLLHLHGVRRREISIGDCFDDVLQLCTEHVQSGDRPKRLLPVQRRAVGIDVVHVHLPVRHSTACL